MPRDPLQVVLRLRRMEVDAARAELTRCETLAEAALVAERQAEATIREEMAVAANLTVDDATVEAFGAWLPQGRQAVVVAAARYVRANEAAGQARARLNLARAAFEAVEKLLEQKRQASSQEELRKQQIALDENAQRSKRRHT